MAMSCGNVPDTAADGTSEEILMPRRRPLRRADRAKCCRCQAGRTVIIVRSLPLCRVCFPGAMTHRISRALHPLLTAAGAKTTARPARQPGAALLALSGGAGSTAMLDFFIEHEYVGRAGETRDRRRGEREFAWARGYAVYVEFAGVTGGVDRVASMRAVAESRGLEFVGLRAEDAFDARLGERLGAARGSPVAVNLAVEGFPLASSSSSTSTPLESLRALVASLPPPSRPALLTAILDHLIAVTACSLPGISHVLLGETATREAQRMIAGTASGRGWALPLELAALLDVGAGGDSGSSETSEAGAAAGLRITRLKPMKPVTSKEAAYYCHVRRLDTVNARRWGAAGPAAKRDARGKGASSIEALTEDFIAGLLTTHPATVSTINKTADKLVFTGAGQTDLCPLCQMPVDPSALAWKSDSALTSLGKPTAPGQAANDAHAAVDLAPLLCYACLTTLTPLTAAQRDRPSDTPVPLPRWVGPHVARRVGPDEMRAALGDFLLDNS